jgi:inorganic pyrophosphatase
MRVFVEVAKNSNLKYEFDKKSNILILDRILHNTNMFPYNYGFIPNTLSPDGDPVDIIILCDFSLIPGSMCDVKIIGGIDTCDESGQDDKIICVLSNKTDKTSKYINDISDVLQSTIDDIIYFLSHYKEGEKNKYVTIGNIYDREKALEIIKKYTLK